MKNYTHCPKCDVQLISKPSIDICPNCGWDSEDDNMDSCGNCGEYHSMNGECPNESIFNYDEKEHISHPLCPHCNHYHSENDPHFLGIDDDLPF